jgi:hypothetical protein
VGPAIFSRNEEIKKMVVGSTEKLFFVFFYNQVAEAAAEAAAIAATKRLFYQTL